MRVAVRAVDAGAGGCLGAEINVFEGVDDRHGTFEDDVAARGLVEGAGEAQGLRPDLVPRGRLS